ncbi:MAG: hypothetical protein KAY82_05165 [Hylemonella sp.]|nr:hypothetical protein [Hylemonella sp.]
MASKKPAHPLDGLVTCAAPIHIVGVDENPLFSVNEGLPMVDVLRVISALISSAKDSLQAVTTSESEHASSIHWPTVYVLNIASGLTDAAQDCKRVEA